MERVSDSGSEVHLLRLTFWAFHSVTIIRITSSMTESQDETPLRARAFSHLSREKTLVYTLSASVDFTSIKLDRARRHR